MRLSHILLSLLLSVPVFAQVNSPTNINIQDEGVAQGSVRTLNCTGAGITCAVSGATGALNVVGGVNAFDVTIDLTPTRDLTTWGTAPLGSEFWGGVTRSPELGIFVAVGARGLDPVGFEVATSTNGDAWIPRVQTNNESWKSVAWSPSLGIFAAVADGSLGGAQTMSSTDGITWTSHLAADPTTWQSVVWSPDLGLFCAVGSASTGTGVMSSTNGTAWTSQTAAEANNWSSVTWSSDLDLFVAVATNGTNRVMTSPNCVNWTSRSAAEANIWTEVTWSPELDLFVAVSFDGTNRAMTSPTGETWTPRAIPTSTWNSVTWATAQAMFVAVGGVTGSQPGVAISSDGIVWTAVPTPVRNGWNAITYASDLKMVVAVGNVTSLDQNQVLYNAYIPPGFVYTVTVTGQSWVTASSRILCSPFGSTTDSLTPETIAASGVQAIASNRVVGTGFDLSVYSPHGATGTYRFHCTGS